MEFFFEKFYSFCDNNYLTFNTYFRLFSFVEIFKEM